MQILTAFFGRRPALELPLTPLVGIGPVLLGITKAEVIAAMKTEKLKVTSEAHGHLYFLENSIQVEFAPEGEATFIGVAPHSGLRLVFEGTDLFDRPASEVFALFQKNESDAAVWADQYEYLFREQIVTLWEADSQYDLSGADRPIWGQIGVGSDAYLMDVEPQ